MSAIVASAMTAGKTYFVSTSGNDSARGGDWDDAFASISKAMSLVVARDSILISPGTYQESVPIAKANISLVGVGPHGSVVLAPRDGVALTVNAPSVMLVNLDITGAAGGGPGTDVIGDGFSASHCKFKSQDDAGIALRFLPLGVVNYMASRARMADCEFAWCATGIQTNINTSAVTESMIERCTFYNCSDAAIAQGSDAATVSDLFVIDCTFSRMRDGTEPAAYMNLAGAGSTGIITRCSFPTSLDGGKNAVAAGVLWVSNYHTGGISNAQPS